MDFARWLLPEEPKTIRLLKTELSIEPIRADFVSFFQTEKQMRAFGISNRSHKL